MARTEWVVTGHDETPDGYHDEMFYRGRSRWQVFKAVRAGLSNDMTVTIKRYLVNR